MSTPAKPTKPAQPKRAAFNGTPSRPDVIVGADGKWMTHGYVSTPVFTKKEPRP